MTQPFRTPSRVARRTLAIVAASALVVGGSALAGGAASAATFVGATPSWPAHPDTQKYVQTPTSRAITPVSIVSTSGDVTNADVLIHPTDGAAATLTATPKNIESHPVTVSFPAVSTRYLRLDVTKLGLPAAGDTGGSYVQLAELQAFGSGDTNLAAGKSVTASETIQASGWGTQHLTDGVDNSEDPADHGYTSNKHTSVDVSGSPIIVTVDLGSAQSVSSVVLWPRTDTLSPDGQTANFPVDYTIQSSSDNASFAVQKTVTAQATPAIPIVTGSASIVLDYGHDVGGYPTFDVSAASAPTGFPTLQAGYSETKRQLSPTGDGITPWASGDGKRYDTYQVTQPGRITNTLIQGGERYEMITLTTPGSISLSAAGIQYTPYIPPTDGTTGSFVSSSDELNKYWYDGSYTAELNQVPVGGAAARWNVADDALDVPGTNGGTAVGLLKQGDDWTDYTVTFKTKIISNQAGWTVRSTDAANGYLIILGAADSTDPDGGPNSLQQFSITNGAYTSLGKINLATPVTSHAWHNIKEVVSGSTVTTFIDGAQAASFTSTAHSAGTIGIREFGSEEAQYSDLSVTNASETLYENDLAAASAVDDFSVPGYNTVPLILDGAKRDRSVWSGDLAVEGPTVYYSSGASDYLKGSIELLGSYAGSNGEVSGTIPPTTPINPNQPGSVQGPYSANYSMYFVRALGDYYQYTGDADFVKKEWPLVANELAYNASLVDGNGLVVTNGSNGADWDYYDSDKTGEVTTYNALYYQVLLDGAKLATVAGQSSLADQYTAKAAALKDAINARLFNATTGLYNLSNLDTNTIAQDANVFAVEFGIAPADKVSGILSGLKSALWTDSGSLPFSGTSYQKTISPYVSGFELNARFGAGDTDNALQLLSSEWGPMIAPGDLYTGAFWENESTSGTQATDSTNMAHGWSTMPTSALSKYVLGIQPVDAGYKTWLVQPHPGDLDWTTGQAPTPHGALVVDWSHDTDTGFAMHVEAPAATSGTIAVPTFGKSIDITVNGAKVWSHGLSIPTDGVASATLDGDYVDLAVASGTFDISTGAAVTTDQTITFAAIADKSATDADFAVSASASSGLPVSFTAAGDCTVSGITVHLTGAGTCTITAAQAGDDQYAAAASVSRSFQVTAVVTTPVTITPSKVTITGDPKVGAKLTAHSGSWGIPVTLAYRWLDNGTSIKGATKATYKLVKADKGDRISVRVTASANGVPSVTVTSSGVKVLLALTKTPRPKLHGTVKVGHRLTVVPGTWKPAKVHLAYRWYRNGVVIKHATAKSYKLVKADKGSKITISVTGSKKGYLSETESRSTAKVK